MTGLVDWAAARARMVVAFVALSLIAGALAYASLPKEGEPDIEIPALSVSVPFPGISALDAEELLVEPMETELSDIDGLDAMTSVAAEGYANVTMEFEFGWDKASTLAEVRDRMSKAEAGFPDGFEQYTIAEFNFSEFPILIVSLSGEVPERTLLRLAEDLQERLEGLDAILEAPLAGHREEMIEVVIDPLRLESYNVTATELLSVVRANNQIVAAGAVDLPTGSNAVKIDGAFDDPRDIRALPCQDQRRPRRHAGRSGRHPPHLRGPRGHRALRRGAHGRAPDRQAQGLQPDRHRRAGARGGGGARSPPGRPSFAAPSTWSPPTTSHAPSPRWWASSRARCSPPSRSS